MKRDIVQFVPFNQFQNAHISSLAKEVLEEVPDQITGFMTMKKLHPLQKGAKHGHLAKQPTMNNIYEGPSTLVRANTQANVYPNIQQQPEQKQNPYYGSPPQQQQYGQQVVVVQQPPPGYAPQQLPYQMQSQPSIYNSQMQVQQNPTNPYYNANPSAPTH